MILTVDAGNTTVCFCAVQGAEHVLFTLRIPHESARTANECCAVLRRALAERQIDPAAFRGAVLSSVVPSLTDPLADAVRSLTGAEPLRIRHTLDTGLTYAVAHPERLGTDRLADAAWAAHRYPLPVVTADIGTATTLNVITKKAGCAPGAVFLGGVIAVGPETALRALHAGTALLPEVRPEAALSPATGPSDSRGALGASEPDPRGALGAAKPLSTPDSVIGTDTVSCMLSGAVVGTAAMIDGMTQRIEAELREPVTLILTGGDARYIEPLCRHPRRYDPDLLAKGLAYLYRRNRGGDGDEAEGTEAGWR